MIIAASEGSMTNLLDRVTDMTSHDPAPFRDAYLVEVAENLRTGG